MNRDADWPPPRTVWPAGLTAYKRGWCIWYKGQKRHVAGRTADRRTLAALWQAKREAIDTDGVLIPTGGDVTLRELAAAYFAALDRRMNDRSARPLSKRQRDNLMYECNRFGKFVGGATLVRDVGPAVFSRYRKHLGNQSPQTIASIIGRVGAMFTWAHRNGVVDKPILFGDAWQRPHRSLLRDQRMSVSKTYSEDDVGKLFAVADPMWRCWIALGVCGGFTVADLANLPREMLAGDVIDYRRRKVGKLRRLVPIVPGLRKLLKAYRRPKPADERFVNHAFLNDAGLPVGHWPKLTEASVRFRDLQQRAGVFRKGRSFTGLRTTCFNAMLKFDETARCVVFGRRPSSFTRIDWEHYLEDVDLDSVRHAVSSVFDRYFKS